LTLLNSIIKHLVNCKKRIQHCLQVNSQDDSKGEYLIDLAPFRLPGELI